jgi:Protein of unknown function (DUF2735)
MTMSHDRRTAEIYQFPLRGRFAAGGKGDEAKSASGIVASRLAINAFGGNWYHEEAIRDAERARKS